MFCSNPNNFLSLLDKMCVKSFPNFTRYHLITHTNIVTTRITHTWTIIFLSYDL